MTFGQITKLRPYLYKYDLVQVRVADQALGRRMRTLNPVKDPTGRRLLRLLGLDPGDGRTEHGVPFYISRKYLRGPGREPGASLLTQKRLSLTGARAKAWCLFIHAEASLSHGVECLVPPHTRGSVSLALSLISRPALLVMITFKVSNERLQCNE